MGGNGDGVNKGDDGSLLIWFIHLAVSFENFSHVLISNKYIRSQTFLFFTFDGMKWANQNALVLVFPLTSLQIIQWQKVRLFGCT